MSHLIHRAAAPDGLVQRCADCGRVLTDYRNAQGLVGWEPLWWGTGCAVFVRERMQTLSYDAPNCTPHEPPDCSDDADPLP